MCQLLSLLKQVDDDSRKTHHSLNVNGVPKDPLFILFAPLGFELLFANRARAREGSRVSRSWDVPFLEHRAVKESGCRGSGGR